MLASNRSLVRIVVLASSIVALCALPARAQDASDSDTEGTAEDTAEGTEESTAEGASDPEVAPSDAPADGDAATASSLAAPAETEAAGATGEDDEDVIAEDEVAAPPPGVPLFRGSLFSWQQGVSIATMAPGLLQTYNPSYYWSFYFQPRLNIDAQNFFVLMLAAAIEWTDSDYTAHEREPVFYDTTLEFRHMERWEGFVFIPAVRLTAPTSLTSVAADRYLQAGVGLTAVRVFPELADLTIALSGRYTHWFAGSNVNTTIDGSTRFCVGGGAGGATGTCSDQVGAAGTERDRILTALTVNVMPIPGFTLTLQYAFTWAYRHDLVSTPTTGPDDSQHWRNAQYFTLAAAYDVQPWLNLQLGYQTSNGFARTLDENGNAFSEHVNPFWDSSGSEIYLVATVPLDALYEAIAPSEGEEQLTPEQLQRRRQGLAQGGRSGIAF